RSSGELPLDRVRRGGETPRAARQTWPAARDRPNPFSLFVLFYNPHKPYSPPSRFSSYAPYDGEIAYSDELVGRLFDRLRAVGLYDRATIILLSDHGEGLGDHAEQEHGLFLYKETTHVPLIVKLPATHAARRVAPPLHHTHLPPTL